MKSGIVHSIHCILLFPSPALFPGLSLNLSFNWHGYKFQLSSIQVASCAVIFMSMTHTDEICHVIAIVLPCFNYVEIVRVIDNIRAKNTYAFLSNDHWSAAHQSIILHYFMLCKFHLKRPKKNWGKSHFKIHFNPLKLLFLAQICHFTKNNQNHQIESVFPDWCWGSTGSA